MADEGVEDAREADQMVVLGDVARVKGECNTRRHDPLDVTGRLH
jgi:hypothetical protein